ncbi:MAG: polysaccharide biosynthesis tyrosine autokinase [Lachnospiraceae bacterium]|nr:polysaccharide biosynthesis tyrosine autokinase [Lachnospiraceae bacterium]
MAQEYSQMRKEPLTLDYAYLFRMLSKSALVILLSTVIVAVAASVGADLFLSDSYTASIQLSVVARDTSTSRQSDSYVTIAVTRCLNVLNSNTLKEQIKKDEGITSISGTISSTQVESTNLITMSTTGRSAEEAFWLLKAALEAYPKLSDYFESGYLVQSYTSLSADNIIRTSPDVKRYTAMAALLSLAAGIGLVVMLVLLTDKIHSRSQAEKMLDIRLLGQLPFIRKKKAQKSLLITDTRTEPVYIEDMDKLTTRIQEHMDSGKYKTLLVTSMRENEGKSTIAANIALNLVQRGKKVLLLDCDMRRPAIYKIFDYEMEPDSSLSDYLSNGCEYSRILKRIPQTDGLLAILQSRAIGEPDKRLEERAFPMLLEIARNLVDYVIMDTPPLGIVRDAEIVAKNTDAAIISFEQDEVHAADINDTVDLLEAAGVDVIGGIMNMARSIGRSGRKNTYGYYSYYYAK